MSRLGHSFSAFIRYMQMAPSTVFAFVEGQDFDPYFYSKILTRACSDSRTLYEVIRASRLNAQGGGKGILLQFHEFLRIKSSLVDRRLGKLSLSVFYLDKDVDDLLNVVIPSQHIVYTEFYCVENHLFEYCVLSEVAASASALEESEFAILGAAKDWAARKAALWREWVVLCLFARMHNLNCDCSYSRATSVVNVPPSAQTDNALLTAKKADMETRSGFSPPDFARAFNAAEMIVNRIYQDGGHHQVFKGKWFVGLLEHDIAAVAGARPYRQTALSSAIKGAIGPTVNFDQAWSRHFTDPIRALIRANPP